MLRTVRIVPTINRPKLSVRRRTLVKRRFTNNHDWTRAIPQTRIHNNSLKPQWQDEIKACNLGTIWHSDKTAEKYISFSKKGKTYLTSRGAAQPRRNMASTDRLLSAPKQPAYGAAIFMRFREIRLARTILPSEPCPPSPIPCSPLASWCIAI